MKHLQMRAKALKTLLDEMGDSGLKSHIASAQDMGKGSEVSEHEGMDEGHGHSPIEFEIESEDEGEAPEHGGVVSRFKKLMSKGK